MNEDVKSKQKAKRRRFAAYMRNRTHRNEALLNNAIDEVKVAMKEAQDRHDERLYSQINGEACGSSRLWWQLVRNIMKNDGNSLSTHLPDLKHQGRCAKTPLEKAEMMADFFYWM